MPAALHMSMPFVMICVVLLAVLLVLVAVDRYVQKERRMILMVLIGLVFSLILQNYMEWTAVNSAPSEEVVRRRLLLSNYGYIVRPVILLLYCRLVDLKHSHFAALALTAGNFLLYAVNFFTPICFYITADNHFAGGPLSNTCLVISVILLVYLMYIIINSYRHIEKREFWLPFTIIWFITVGVILDYRMTDSDQVITYLTIAVVGSTVFFYIWLHLQFVREHEEDLIAGQRMKIMVSQIQPHFLYNTLATIQTLCEIDPQKASEVTERLAVYLRQNLESLEETDRIPLEKELEHTRIYSEIEMIRFPNIQVLYDIHDKDFTIPALTIQPMVENAIRHGVRIRKEGWVRVIVRRAKDWHEILVEDNGRGFDVHAADNNDPSHIGIRNVRERIEKMCGGELRIESRPGEGTSVTIRIPVRQEVQQ